ncbi:MAG: hypothetical protein AAGU27_20980 [Dehalobacterium sp.]
MDDSAGSAGSVFSVVISIFDGLLSAIATTSGAGVSVDIRISVVSSDRASISAVTAVFTGSAGKFPDLGALRPHNGTQRDTGDNAYPDGNLLLHIDHLLSAIDNTTSFRR